MKRYTGKRVVLLMVMAVSLCLQGFAQKPTVAVEEAKLASKLMTREMPYRVYLPPDYEKASTERFTTIYLLHGLTGHYTNWGDKTKLREYAANYRYIIVMVEGDNGWYSDSASTPADKYESYIIQELIPEIDKKYRTQADREHRVIAGLSMGGYGSLKFGVKYPEKFAIAGSFSGAVAAADYTEKKIGNLGKSIDAVFGAEASATRNSNDLFKHIRELTPEKQKALPFLYFDCGTEDFLFQTNMDLLDLMRKQKVPHEFRELPGVHDWVFWNSQIKEFLEVVQNRVK